VAKSQNTSFGLEGETRMPAATMGTRARRTSQLILEMAQEVFLAKGYFGTNIEDIAEAANVSRASFYTYFPSKRDVLVKIGEAGFVATQTWLDDMLVVAAEGGDDAVERIVASYLDLLDNDGAFAAVWGQATLHDEDLRRAGTRAQLHNARRFADVLTELGWDPGDLDRAKSALALQLMMDRYWFQTQVGGLRGTRPESIAILSSVIRSLLPSSS
jgi:AcrR family transcriptional regulator